jgi:hypothetical protein
VAAGSGSGRGETSGWSATVHGPVGSVLTATPIALSEVDGHAAGPRSASSVSVTTKLR